MSAPAYKRILLKISGEALAAGQGFGVDNTRVHEIAAEIAEVHRLGIEIAIVVGGGNFFRVVVFAGGTGNPYFSTDTAASLRAMEIKADAILKATKVDGIYSDDPVLVKDATMFDEISYMDVLRLGLRVMDATAIALCRENNLPIVIFNLNQRGNIQRVVMGERIGSLVNQG